MIVRGSASQTFAAALAAATDRELATVECDRFPDCELMAAVPAFEGERAIIVAATVSSDAHVECLLVQDAVRQAGASEVTTVIPYMGYARQDDACTEGGAGLGSRGRSRRLDRNGPGANRQSPRAGRV